MIDNVSQLPNTLKSLQNFMEECFLLSILNKVLNSLKKSLSENILPEEFLKFLGFFYTSHGFH